MGSKGQKKSDEGHVAYQIIGKEVKNIMQVWPYAHPCPFGLGKKVRHWNCADKYILIELSDLIVFDYGLSDTQDVFKYWRNGVNYILWLTSSPCLFVWFDS